MAPGKSALSLYRQILRCGRRLKLTDYQYFCSLVRRDFVRFGSERDPKEVAFQLDVRAQNISYNKPNVQARNKNVHRTTDKSLYDITRAHCTV